MSILARLLSRPYRLGLAAEAAGDLESAAKAFAEAGKRGDLARVRRLLGVSSSDPAVARGHLRAALALLDEEGAAQKSQREETRKDLARLLLASPGGEEAALEEAASLFGRAGDHRGAAEALVRLGRMAEARDELARGRHFERLEELDLMEAGASADKTRREAALALARDALACGRRSEAQSLARGAMELAPEEAGEILGRLAEGRLDGRMVIGFEGSRSSLTCVSENPVILGRGEESSLLVRDPGISRHHAHIERSRGHDWLLCDLSSRNGTFVDGLPIADAFPLEGTHGSFSLGEHCRIGWLHRLEQGLLLTVEKGLSAGSRLLALAGETALDDLVPGALRQGASEAQEPGANRPTAMLSWSSGWFVVDTFVAGDFSGEGIEAGSRLELLHGDRLQMGGLLLEFVRAR